MPYRSDDVILFIILPPQIFRSATLRTAAKVDEKYEKELKKKKNKRLLFLMSEISFSLPNATNLYGFFITETTKNPSHDI